MRLALVLLLALSSCMPTPAFSHSFYPKDCCSDADCDVLASSRVQVTPAGYVIDGRELIPHGKALWSPDADYHGCFPKALQGRVGCFWAPRQAM